MSRTDAKALYSNLKDTISVDGEFEDWRTGNIAVENVFDQRIADDLLEAGATEVTLAVNGPGYDLAPVKEWISWRDSKG